MSKISQYAQDTAPTSDDYVIGVDAAGPTTKRYVLSDLITLFLNNIPATEGSFAFVSSGLVWTADAVGSTRVATMTSGRIRVNTTFLAIAAVTSRTFTASKDTYIDILDNLDGTGTIVYTEVTNNAASAALASNSVRIGIIVTGATTIAAVGSINQGEEYKILPIASSIAYSVTDSIGNLICPRDPNHKILSIRQITAGVTATTIAQATGLSCPVIIPTGRKIAIAVGSYLWGGNNTNSTQTLTVWDGVVNSGTEVLGYSRTSGTVGADQAGMYFEETITPSATSKTYNVGIAASAGTDFLGATSSRAAFLKIKLD